MTKRVLEATAFQKNIPKSAIHRGKIQRIFAFGCFVWFTRFVFLFLFSNVDRLSTVSRGEGLTRSVCYTNHDWFSFRKIVEKETRLLRSKSPLKSFSTSFEEEATERRGGSATGAGHEMPEISSSPPLSRFRATISRIRVTLHACAYAARLRDEISVGTVTIAPPLSLWIPLQYFSTISPFVLVRKLLGRVAPRRNYVWYS